MLVGYPVFLVTEFADDSPMLQRMLDLGLSDEQIVEMAKETFTILLEKEILPEANNGWSEARVLTLNEVLETMSPEETESFLSKWKIG